MDARTALAEPLFDAAPAEVRLAAERAQDAADVAALVERAFGPGRYAKVSERLREGNTLHADLSFCAFGAGVLVGTVRQWPVMVGETKGVFLGPIAVEAAWRKHGVGGLLIERCCTAVAAAGEAFILLVGDMPLFGPHGFAPAPTGSIVMPGPVNPSRILLRSLSDGGLGGIQGLARVPRA
jgi:predicted N-acetyltransferase YhbS